MGVHIFGTISCDEAMNESVNCRSECESWHRRTEGWSPSYRCWHAGSYYGPCHVEEGLGFIAREALRVGWVRPHAGELFQHFTFIARCLTQPRTLLRTSRPRWACERMCRPSSRPLPTRSKWWCIQPHSTRKSARYAESSVRTWVSHSSVLPTSYTRTLTAHGDLCRRRHQADSSWTSAILCALEWKRKEYEVDQPARQLGLQSGVVFLFLLLIALQFHSSPSLTGGDLRRKGEASCWALKAARRLQFPVHRYPFYSEARGAHLSFQGVQGVPEAHLGLHWLIRQRHWHRAREYRYQLWLPWGIWSIPGKNIGVVSALWEVIHIHSPFPLASRRQSRQIWNERTCCLVHFYQCRWGSAEERSREVRSPSAWAAQSNRHVHLQ